MEAANSSVGRSKSDRWRLASVIAIVALCSVVVGLLALYFTSCKSEPLEESGTEEHEKAEDPLPYIRLPRSVVPVHYDVELQPYIIPGNFTFYGKVRILMTAVGQTDNVTLHVNDITVHASSVRLAEARSGNVVQVASTSEDTERQFYVLYLKGDLKRGLEYVLEMEFLGSLNDQLMGFYRSFYTDSNGNERWLACTQFEATSARRAFPCFDEPAMKATFNLTIVRWTNMTSISNMPIYKTEPRGDGWVADYFQKTVRMSTYLLAFVVSDFKNAGTSEFSVWSRSDVLNTTGYALHVGPRILKFYEDFFNIKYPLPKTDMVAIPDFASAAMENWGLITYDESSLLYDQRYSSTPEKQGIAMVISHELAHQWFGNLVTLNWWDDLWLNEGFASYVEHLGVDAVHPEWRVEEMFVLGTQSVMGLDSLVTSHAISLPVNHPDEINELFDSISYGKASAVIRMMRHFLGDKNFRNGLMNYLNAKKFSNAVPDDLWEHMTAVQDKSQRIDVKKVMDSWTLQTGYPLVEVTRDYRSNTAQVKQYRFLLRKGEDADSRNVQWEIPFTYTDGLDPNWTPNTKLWLHKTNGTIAGLPSSRHWILGNLQQVGFYRVNYDEHNWELIIQQLVEDHTVIHTMNRAQIICDALELASAGILSYPLALNTTKYLHEESEFLPWSSALNSFRYIDSMIIRTALYGKWKEYVINRLEPLYDSLGWEGSPEENVQRQHLRVMVLYWMCGFDHKDCIKIVREKFSQWRANPTNINIIHSSLRGIVFCTAVRNGGDDIWNFFWKMYKVEQTASEKNTYMNALTCTRQPWLLMRYLNWSLSSDSGIRLQDGFFILGLIGNSLYGRDMSFNYIRDKWDTIVKLYSTAMFSVGSLIKDVAESMNTRFELYELKQFYNAHKHKLGAGKRDFQQAIENVEINVQWMDNYYSHISQWLDSVTKN